MSYSTWRAENEDSYLQTIKRGYIRTYQRSLSDEALATAKTLEEIENKFGSSWKFFCVFAKYLEDEYHVSPEDLEILQRYSINTILKLKGQLSVMHMIDRSHNNKRGEGR